MSNRKTTTATVSGDPAAAQDNMNTLYAAHQVHTLAQIVFQRLTAAGLQSQAPWSQSPAQSPGRPFGAMPPGPGFWPAQAPYSQGPGFAPVPQPALFYWYP